MPNQTEANLSALIESTEDHIWSVDLSCRLILFNRAFQRHVEQIYGVQVAVGMRPEDMFLLERAAPWPQLFKRALSEGPFRIEHSLLDGHTLEMAFNPIIADGEATGVSVFGKDITERKAAESALKEAEKKYRAIFDGALEGMFQISPERTPLSMNRALATMVGERALEPAYRRHPLSMNRALAKMLGYDSPEEVYSTVKDVAREAWAYQDERARFLRKIDEHGTVRGFECQLKRKDGSNIWVSLNARRVCGVDGQLLCHEGFATDITERKLAEMQLRDSEERYRATFEQAAVGIVHASFDGRYLRCNTRFAEIVGYALEEIPGMTFQQITLPEDQAKCEAARQQMASGAIEGASLEKRYLRKDGSLTWVKLTCSTQRDAEGRALHNIAIVEDINARKTAEESLAAAQEALRLSEERYRTAFQTSRDAIQINCWRDGGYIDVNQAFLDNLGFEREEVIGRTSQELGIWADAHDRQRLVEMLRQNSSCSGLEARLRKKNGEILWGQISASMFELDGVPCILSITRDISDAKLAEEEIRNLAFYDPLTALPNRRLLLERLRQALVASVRSGRSRALLSIDLDNFKTLNDTLGHQTGDLVLQEAARRIAACVRAADTVGRLSGDEFVVMLEDLSKVPEEAAAQAKAVGEKILASIHNPYLIEGRECRSTCSIGITIFGGRRNSTDEILQQADIALHQAKAAGRDTIRFFSRALQAAVNARAAMEEDLRQAIKTNQFLLYYQPQVEWGRLTGAEALIRWRHPARGIMSSDEFIPLAEESRLILPMGDWVMETACAQIASWAGRKQTAHFTVAVNISTLQFRQPEFVEQVLAALDRTGANPENLKLELTESMLANNIEDIIAKMTELKSHGLRFSLDDFGTGYSSLAYLKRFPLDELKIDRAFVRDILEDSTSGAIAQTIISLGRAMGLSVIAEGVETEEQQGFLAALGCHAFQGYLLSRPLPLKEFDAFLQNFAESCAPLRGAWESYAREIGTGEPILSRWAMSLTSQNENPRGKISLELPGWREK